MTNIDHHDEIPVPHFEDRLWAELAEAHATARDVDDVAGTDHRTARPALRRRARRSLIVGVAAAAVAALVASVAVTTSDGGGDGDDVSAGAEQTTTVTGDAAPPVSLDARIVAATDEALADSVVHTVLDMATGTDSEMWTDEQSGAMRSLSLDEQGAPAFDSGPAAPPGVDDVGPGMPPPGTPPFDPSLPQITMRQVDHCFGEYRDFEQAALPGSNEAARVRDGLADGSMVRDGMQVVDGRELIRVVPVIAPATGAGDAGGATATTDTATPQTTPADPDAPAPGLDGEPTLDTDHVTLVDPETHRPVMLLGYPGSSAEYVMTFEYLPRTPENLALLSPPVPDGFVQTDVVRGDGERLDRCGG